MDDEITPAATRDDVRRAIERRHRDLDDGGPARERAFEHILAVHDQVVEEAVAAALEAARANPAAGIVKPPEPAPAPRRRTPARGQRAGTPGKAAK